LYGNRLGDRGNVEAEANEFSDRVLELISK